MIIKEKWGGECVQRQSKLVYQGSAYSQGDPQYSKAVAQRLCMQDMWTWDNLIPGTVTPKACHCLANCVSSGGWIGGTSGHITCPARMSVAQELDSVGSDLYPRIWVWVWGFDVKIPKGYDIRERGDENMKQFLRSDGRRG